MLKFMPWAALACAVAGAAPALAATGWNFGNISFAPRQGWCPARAAQDATLEVRPCDEDFPALSIGIAQSKAARQDLASLAAADADKAADEDGKKRVLETMAGRTGNDDCTENSYAVDRSPMPGVASYSVAASFICGGNEDMPALFHVFTAYAQGRDGSVWTVSFDHPGGPISNNDRAMIKAAIAKISGR
jgi:hypothetical protein